MPLLSHPPPVLLWHTPDPRRLRLLYYSLQHFYELWSAFPLLGAHHILMCGITRQHLWFFLFFKLFSGDLQFVILAGNLIGRLRCLLLPTWQLKTLLAQGLNAFAFAFAFALTLELSFVQLHLVLWGVLCGLEGNGWVDGVPGNISTGF